MSNRKFNKMVTKVRVIGAQKESYWYAKFIGETFDVMFSGINGFSAVDPTDGARGYLESEDIEPVEIRYNNERYRLESRKAEVGEKVVVVDAQCNVTYKNGDIRTVLRRWNNNLGFRSEEHGSNICDDECRVLVPVKSAASALTANVNVKLCEDTTKIIDMLTSLSMKVTELEREVQMLKERQFTVNMPEITVNTPVTTEEIAERVQKALEPLIGRPLAKTEDKPKPLTRADVVAQAQVDVAGLKQGWSGNYLVKCSPDGYTTIHRECYADFIVSHEKRTVVCLLRGVNTNKVRAKGIAKCAPDDVFNADIGRAIALRRALGLAVPSEYTDAPKPEGVVVGDVINHTFITGRNANLRVSYEPSINEETCRLNSLAVERGRVIDDSDREEYRKGERC